MDKLIGKRLDGCYEVESLIGSGGMANVYKAKNLRNGASVAIKVLKEEYMHDQDLVRRFKNESKAISILNHPNIVKVYDVSVTDKLQYIVMEYLDGITLRDYLNQRGGKITWRETIHFITQILSALQHAHENGVVHRDVKPQNIMLLANGDLKMMDFGIARISRAENQLVSGKAMGSVHYISPEQAKGDVTDAKSDIYSVGVMMYEMLSGKLPFDSDSAVKVAIKQISDKAVPLDELEPDIPHALVQITQRAMAKNPADRYPTAADMQADIRKFKEDPEIRFEYKYMTENSSAKVIDRVMSQKKNTGPTGGTTAEKKKKKYFLPILFGITLAFCIACAVMCNLILRNSSSPLFSNKGDIVLPDFKGMTEDEVKENSVYSKIKVEFLKDYNSNIAEGLVYKQTPRAQRTVKEGQTVTLTVSMGTHYVDIPDLTNMAQDDAAATLKEKGFNVLIVQNVDPNVAVGAVIRTDPAANETAEAGSTVVLYVSRAEVDTTTTVPDLTGLTYQDALVALTSAKLSMGAQTHIYSDYPPGTICAQGIAPATEVKITTRIPIYISDGPEPAPDPTPEPAHSQIPQETPVPQPTLPAPTNPQPTAPAPTAGVEPQAGMQEPTGW
jgi:serine/threonine protein kinase